jgi:predicted PurR-regulated permease PerM
VALPSQQRRGEIETFAIKVAIVCAFGIALTVLWLARHILVLIFVAAMLAAGIAPAVRRIQILGRYWFKRKIPRGAAVLIVYLPVVIGVLLLALMLLPRVASDGRELMTRLPPLIDQNILKPLEKYVPMDAVREQMRGGVSVPRSSVVVYVRSAGKALGSIVAILVMIAYMLVDAERLRNLMLLVYPPEVRGDRRQTLKRMGRRMTSWLSAQLLLSGIIGGATFVGFVILGIPYSVPLAILAGVGEVVPVLGPTLGAIPALALALLQSKTQFWCVLVFIVLLQKIENLFIVPRVMSRKVSISPLAVLIAFMIGASLFGAIGAIMAMPVAAIVQVTFEEAFVARRERRLNSGRSGTLLRRVD